MEEQYLYINTCIIFSFFTRYFQTKDDGSHRVTAVVMMMVVVEAAAAAAGTVKTLKNHQTAKRAPKIRFYRVDYTNTIYINIVRRRNYTRVWCVFCVYIYIYVCTRCRYTI